MVYAARKVNSGTVSLEGMHGCTAHRYDEQLSLEWCARTVAVSRQDAQNAFTACSPGMSAAWGIQSPRFKVTTLAISPAVSAGWAHNNAAPLSSLVARRAERL